MNKYMNFSGESTITHYEMGEDYIILKSKKGLVEYCAQSNSQLHIDKMKALAQKGTGLSRYILKYKIKQEGIAENDTYERLKSIFSFK